MNKFNIGDKVWYATSGSREQKVLCPECFGKRQLRVILGDDSEVLIPCEGCSYRPEGYYDSYPSGYCRYYEWYAEPRLVTITGLEINQEKVEYRSHTGSGSYWCFKEDECFLTEEEAKFKADQMVAEHNAKELEKIYTKEKHNRTWAWNLSYHRKRIKDAEREIEYHSKKFEYAKTRVKDEKSQVAV